GCGVGAGAGVGAFDGVGVAAFDGVGVAAFDGAAAACGVCCPPPVCEFVPPDEPDEPDESVELVSVDELNVIVSIALPRSDGSRTIWLTLTSSGVVPGRGRLTLTVTVHSPETLPFSQSRDHCQLGSSSNGAPFWALSGTAPAMISASLA